MKLYCKRKKRNNFIPFLKWFNVGREWRKNSNYFLKIKD